MRRRRFLKIIGISSLTTVVPLRQLLAIESTRHYYSAEVMNGLAGLTLILEDSEQARRISLLCFEEIRRLEKIFSLFIPGSSIRELNEKGVLKNPPIEMVEVLLEARKLSELSDGIFDVTLQPLWKYLFYQQDKQVDLKMVKRLKKLVDYQGVKIAKDGIWFNKPGMEITLNGIAQGYITDKVTELLKANGMKQVLVELGETYALGRSSEGSPWRVGIANPEGDGILRAVDLEDKALATSAGSGTRFGQSSLLHHLINPKTGLSANFFKSVSVIANRATHADGLSTTLSLLDSSSHGAVLAHYEGASVFVS
jgi:thiamine biosynthesis lipoprotein